MLCQIIDTAAERGSKTLLPHGAIKCVKPAAPWKVAPVKSREKGGLLRSLVAYRTLQLSYTGGLFGWQRFGECIYVRGWQNRTSICMYKKAGGITW